MEKQTIQATIDANIKTNGKQEITGAVLNSVLNGMVDYSSDPDGRIGQLETDLQQTKSEIMQVDATGAVVPQVFIDQWDSACDTNGQWNSSTKYFELNGLTNITYAQALTILTTFNKPIGNVWSNANIYYKGRTNLPFSSWATSMSDLNQFLRSATNIEVLQWNEIVSTGIKISSLSYTFYGCSKLKTIATKLDLFQQPSLVLPFFNCKALESVTIHRLKQSIPFSESPNLNKDSLVYMLQNRANAVGTPITITLHPTAYAKYSVDSDITALLPATSTQGAVNLASA